MKIRKLIQKEQQSLVVCDNKECDYTVPYSDDDDIIVYVNKPCPKCGQNLLTIQDYIAHKNIMKYINWINKYFSWIILFISEKKTKSTTATSIHYHEGSVTIKKVKI